ncbi:MAG: response regulator [Deltaproteobacteria bacterium]|nr:response regulator [Deltaproteobacteria bacterium]
MERGFRILVVDDEAVVRRVIRSALDRPGLYLVEAEDGERAIELLLDEPFDLVIADKNLPGITGLDVIRRAKAVDARMGLLLVTAYASRESAEEAMAIGVDDYIVKPFELGDLVAKVDEALDRRVKLQRGEARRPEPRPSLRVLVCDPSEHSRTLVLAALRRLGHDARPVASLRELLAGLRDEAADAIVCDLDLLGRDDATACFLRSKLILSPSVRFVALASTRGLADAIEAIHRGARKVLYRPLQSEQELVDALRDFLGA